MKHLTPEQLSACLDNELRGQAQEEVKAHLASCAECREELARLAALEKLTQSSELEPREEAYFQTFSSRVLEGIAQEKPVPFGESLKEWFKRVTTVPIFRLQWLGGLAVAALVIGFGIYIYERPYLIQPSYKANQEAPRKVTKIEAPSPAVVTAPPSEAERRSRDLGTVPVSPSVSGELKAPASDGKLAGIHRPEAEVEQPVTLAVKAPASAPEVVLVPAEKPALDKSMAATARGEGPREEVKKEKTEDLTKARPEGYTALPAAGATGGTTATTSESDRLATMASPSEREKAGKKVGSDEILFADAQTKQSNQYYRDAAKDYDSLVRNYPKSARYDDANYNLALSEYANSQQTRKPEDLRRALKVSKTFLKAVRDTARKAQVNRQVVVIEKQLKEIK